MGCYNIAFDNAVDCKKSPKQGLVQSVVLINKDDLLDVGGLVTSIINDSITVIDIKLKTGKTGYTNTDVNRNIKMLNEGVSSDVGMNGWMHSLTGFSIHSNSREGRAFAQAIQNTAVIAVVKRNWSDGGNGYLILGGDMGLMGVNMKEDSEVGVIKFDLKTPDGSKESALPYILLMATETATAASFANKFKGAVK